MKLFELFNKILSWKKEHEYSHECLYTFNLETGERVEVNFDTIGNLSDQDESGVWIAFSREGDYGLTGGGQEHEIFATVFDIIDYYVNKYKPKYLIFEAEKAELSRVKFYKRLWSRGIHGYKGITVRPPNTEGEGEEVPLKVWNALRYSFTPATYISFVFKR